MNDAILRELIDDKRKCYSERDERQKLLEKVFGENCPNCTFCQKVYGVLSCVWKPREWEPIPDEGRLPKCPFLQFERP